jgi:DNA-binding CsgD family transcriptional regulator
MDSLAVLSSLVALIYDAALDPKAWPDFLQGFSDAMGGVPANLLYHDLRDHRGSLSAIARMDPEALQKYNAHFSETDPWIVEGERRGLLHAGSVQVGDALVPRSELLKTEYYNELAQPYGLTRLLGAVIRRDGTVVSIISAFRPDRRQPFGENEHKLLRLLLPHLQRAMHIRCNIDGITIAKNAVEDALNRVSIGVILARADSTVVFVNQVAREILEKRDGLTSTAAGLRAAVPIQNRQLQSLVRTAAQGPDATQSSLPGEPMALSRPSLRRPLSVLVFPVSENVVETPAANGRLAALFVADPERSVQTDVDILQKLWGLTRTEAKIASMIVSGKTIADISDQLDVSRSTIRWHLKTVLNKTQTSRQAELMRVLTTSPAFLNRVKD